MNRFIVTDMTLSANVLANCVDGSAVVNVGVSYATLNNLTLGLSVTGYPGPSDAEYTIWGNATAVQATVGVSF
jgi:hypothetical protein